jgi:S1-C subfamily serine protease
MISARISSSLARLLPLAAASAYASTSSSAGCEAAKEPATKKGGFSSSSLLQKRSRVSPYFSRNFVADAVEKVLPSVVRVEVRDGANQRGSGSGFAVDASEILPHVQPGTVLVVTNAHCVLTC